MTITVLFLIFPSVNTLDVNGPLEVLCNWALRSGPNNTVLPPPYKIHIAAKSTTPPIQAWEFVQMTPDLTFKDATDLIHQGKIDVVIVPGFAPGNVGPDLINHHKEILEPINAFLHPKNAYQQQKWLISICVGAVIVNATGAFDGRKATTHFGLLPSLQEDPKQKAEWVLSRWVDGGVTDDNVRILSSGGISCGIDCMLWFVEQTLPKDNTAYDDSDVPKGAQRVAYMMDYEWNGGPRAPVPTTQQLPGAEGY